MLTQHYILARFFAMLALVVCGVGMSLGQGTVGFLRTSEGAPGTPTNKSARVAASTQSFTFERNLIFFEALVDGRPGRFILDTGAPSLIMNDRGQGSVAGSYTGLGAGGEVRLSDHRVDRFEMGGRRVENYWAIGLDLSAFEERTDRRIDGFVGYDLLNRGELRIDYGQEIFELRRSVRRPTHGGRAPRAVLKFFLLDHLPVVQLELNGRKWYFALDTGAGANLLDGAVVSSVAARVTANGMNVQGLDGAPADCPVVATPLPSGLPVTAGVGEVEFVAMGVAHLQQPQGVQLAGVLGSAFLSRYTVGIDYRRQRVYLW
ncbi:retropepsin-like aspartic protease [Neolewinella sp.]|uniref:retropepsin-like aspartic protease n=1 Tax=Neolewinella sp. TaxID=2993543 RepID=UPI003B51DA13